MLMAVCSPSNQLLAKKYYEGRSDESILKDTETFDSISKMVFLHALR